MLADGSVLFPNHLLLNGYNLYILLWYIYIKYWRI